MLDAAVIGWKTRAIVRKTELASKEMVDVVGVSRVTLCLAE